MADTFVSDARKHFSVGQTVRAQIVQVDATRGRFNVTLKSALTASADGALLASLFADLEVCPSLILDPCCAHWLSMVKHPSAQFLPGDLNLRC